MMNSDPSASATRSHGRWVCTGASNSILPALTNCMIASTVNDFPVKPVKNGAGGGTGRTPNIASVIQEVVNCPGWASGNAIAIIITSTGQRIAKSYDKYNWGAPYLHIHCTLPAPTATSIPVAFELIRKPLEYCDLKTRKRKRASLVTKNELMRSMLEVCMKNKLKFRFVLFDIWFSSKENMCYIKETLQKDFVCALKANRLAAGSKEDYQNNRFTSIEDLPCQEETLFTGWRKGVPFLVLLVRQIFTNQDGSRDIFYLACSDTTVTRAFILTTYQKRWPIEVFHKSLKQNAALGKAPVRCVVTQNNHVFAALYALFKLECLKIKRHLNHFALRAHLYLKAIHVAYDELQTLKAT